MPPTSANARTPHSTESRRTPNKLGPDSQRHAATVQKYSGG